MKPILIKYDVARFLAKTNRDIGVYCPRTGNWNHFDDPQWDFYGIMRDLGHIEAELGIGGIDNEYLFVWMKPE